MADDVKTRDFTLDQAYAGILVPTGEYDRLVIRLPELLVRLLIDPSTPPSEQRFKLIGGQDIATPNYTQTRTGEDDLIEGDDYMDLKFTKLLPGLMYWLEVDPGGDRPKYMAFEAIPWADIKPG